MIYSKTLSTIASTLLMILVLSVPSVAQTGSETWIANGFGHFLISVIAGVLLAFAFQFLLTNLAVATGITAIGNVQDKFNQNRTSPTNNNSDDKKEEDNTPTGVKISSGVGIYLVITMTISLFFASLIAVKLSLTPNNYIGFTLGLVIWAGYLLLALYIDSKMISSLTGTVFSSVKDGLSAGSSAVGNIFGASETSRMKDTAQQTVKAIHDEIRQEYDVSGIQRKIDDYVNKLEPQQLNIDNLKEEVAGLIHSIQVKEEYAAEDPQTIKRMFLEVASKQPNISEEDKEKLKDTFEQAKEIQQGEGSRTDKVMSAVDQMAPEDANGQKYREKVEQYLRETDKEELNPNKLKEDLDKILSDPKAAPGVVEERVSKFDRSTLTSLISNMEGMSEEKTEEYVSKAEEALETVKSKAKQVQSEGKEGSSQMSDQIKAEKASAEQAIKKWFDRMNKPELRYNRLKHDMKHIMDDPKATPSILKNRLKKMDRDSMIALVSNNSRIDREQAEKVADKIEEGRDEVLQKADEIERKLKEKTEQAKQETMRQIENTRKTAAAAAWWIFLAAVVSGGASALGGILALTI